MSSPKKGNAKQNRARARRVARKEKRATQAKVTVKRQQSTRASRDECRNCGKYGHKAADCWYKQPPKPQGKGKGSGKSKSKATEISESECSKQGEETGTPNTSESQSSLSQVDTIGCADEGLWIFSLEDSKKRQHTVNWEGQSDCKTEEQWTLEYLDRLWLHVQMKGCQQRRRRRRFRQYFHLHLRQTVMCPKCEDEECTQKHSGSEPSGQKSAELLDARHARLPVLGSHTHTRECKSNQDAWDERPSRISGGGETWNCWRSRYTTAGPEWKFGGSRAEEDQRHLINWNQSTMNPSRRRHEWQETFFTSVVRTV